MTISALTLLAVLTSAYGQNYITPKFVPTPRTPAPLPTTIQPAQYVQQRPDLEVNQPIMRTGMQAQKPPDDPLGAYIRTELPGPQRLFMRESEARFYDRIAQDAKKTPGATRAIFPEPTVISRERHQPRHWENMPPVIVEAAFVCHRRLLFEQPNFERAGYDFGILQPGICVGVFLYDVALMPYHAFSDLHDPVECNTGKCLPGDPAPLYVPRERLSVTGLAAQGASIVGLLYLFPQAVFP